MKSPFPTPWLDIVYVAQPECSSIQVRVGSFCQKFPTLHGGPRMICAELPETGELEWEISGDGPLEVVSMACRRSRDEFHPLHHNKDAIEQAKHQMGFLPVSIQWFVTWKCNYACSYCWQETVAGAYRGERPAEATVDQWVDAITRLEPQQLYLTGGEPTIHRGIVELVSRLGTHAAPVYLTTNLGRSFRGPEWVKGVPPEALDNITCSFHPTQTTWPEWAGKWRALCDHFGPDKVGLEMVKHPDNLRFLPELERLIEEYQPRVANIDDYFEQPQQMIKPVTTGPCYHQPDFRRGTPPETSTDPRLAPKYCAAGMRRINIDPKGDAYTCMSAVDRSKMFGRHALPHYSPIGNVLDPDFKLNDGPTLCWETFRCSSCDVAQVASTWTNHGSNRRLPIPE